MAYVSKELTHFTAWDKETPEEQYAVLAKILRMGWLAGNKDAPGAPHQLHIMPGNLISKNRMLHSGAICFCDIPVADFGIHIAKYSPFGLAFTKAFLLPFGANPVLYIANDSVLGTDMKTGEQVTRGEGFDEMCRGIWYRFTTGVRLLQEKKDLHTDARTFIQQFQHVDAFCVYRILTYMKLFDVAQDETAADNFYMEREWRTPVDVQFTLQDVCRIILPKEWEATFRKDFPDYSGEVTPAPEGVVRVPRTVHPSYYPGEIGMKMVVTLARKGTGEKSSAIMTFGPMDKPEAGIRIDYEDDPENPGHMREKKVAAPASDEAPPEVVK